MTAILPHSSDISPTAEPGGSAQRPRRRFRRRLGMILGVLAAGVLAFAPLFVAKSPLRHRILPILLPDYPAKITTGQATLFWWSRVELGDVRFHDTAGGLLLEVEKITSEKSLVALLADQIRVGGFFIENPRLKILIRDAGSNLEETIAPLFAAQEDSAGLDCEFHVQGGGVEIVDEANQQTSTLQNLRADIRLPLDPAEAITVRGAMEILNAGIQGKAGAVDFDLSYRQLWESNNTPAGEAGTLRLKTRDLHLPALSALFGRIGKPVNLTGVVVSDLSAEWTTGPKVTAFKMDGGLTATGFSLTAPAWLGSDTFKLEYLTHQGQIEYHNGDLHLTKVETKSDVLICEADGVLNLPLLWKAWQESAAEIPLEDFHLTGEVNAARIARMLPETFRLREGLELKTGKLLLSLDAETQNAEQQLTGTIRTSRIAAMADGREIVWNQPLELNLKARNSQAGPVLEELTCRSEFLSLWAQGTPENATVKGSCKLDILMAELNRFADLEDWQVAGRIDAGLTVRRLSPDLIRSAASAVIKDLRIGLTDEKSPPPWKESQLTLTAGGDIVSTPEGPRELQNLSLKITSGEDKLELTQRRPLALGDELSPLAVTAEVRGDLESWQNRLRPFLSSADWQAQGRITAGTRAKLSRQRITLESASADFQNLRLKGPGINLSEARMHLETAGEWSAERQMLRLPRTTWASPSLSLRADDLRFLAAPEATPRATGRVVFRGSVAGLSRWLSLQESLGPDRQLAGIASGQIDLTLTDAAADVGWNLQIEKAVLTGLQESKTPPGVSFRPVTDPRQLQPKVVWSEERLALRGGGIYDFNQDQLELRSTQVETPWLKVSASGNIQETSTRGIVDLTGTLACDLEILAERYRDVLGENLEIAGHDPRRFSVRGPLWGAVDDQRVPAELAAFASLPWERIRVYGLPAGAGELRADLNAGTLHLGPLDVPVGTGRLKLKSRLPLNAADLTLRLEKGPLLEEVRLSPEVCRSWIKLALPVLGDSTEAEGRFSVSLTEEGTIPLATPAESKGAAVLEIESAQMRPGRLANAFLDVITQAKALLRGEPAGRVLPADQTLIRLDKQSVNVRCANGRVHHQNLKMVLTNVPITTSGSVGFDETLALTAEIPIGEDWIKDNRLLAGLKGQTLKIPVGGTLSQPRLDTRAVFQSLQQATQNATGRLLEDGLQNQLDRLFKPR